MKSLPYLMALAGFVAVMLGILLPHFQRPNVTGRLYVFAGFLILLAAIYVALTVYR